jgi:hypothetical protein
MANRGNIFSVLLTGLRDTSGVSLSGGTVYFYAPGTVIAKSVYTDDDLTNAVNSVELDANGQAEIYGRGLYDVVVKDADEVVLYSWESVFLGKDVFVSTSVIADYNATADDSLILVDTSAGNVTVTLPDPATMQQAPYIVKTTADANTVTISRTDTTINGDANYVVSSQWEGVQIAFDETNFYTLGNYATIATTITTEATTSTAGKVELATSAETITGTDPNLAVTPAALKAALDLLSPVLAPAITGMTISNAADTEHDITIATGSARDAGNTTVITLSAAITKQIDANWTAGSAAGGFPSGLTIANSTWYRVFVIRNPSTGVVDAGFDTSATAANLLADATGFTQYRRVGWVRTDGSANIINFRTVGDRVVWNVPILDQSITATTTTATLHTITAPINMDADLVVGVSTSSATFAEHYALYTAEAQTDTTASSSAYTFYVARSNESYTRMSVALCINVGANQRIRSRYNDTNYLHRIMTIGWTDDRRAA